MANNLFEMGQKDERERCIKIIKSHIEPTYPVNCKAIVDEISPKNKKEKKL